MAESHEEDMEESNPFLDLFEEESALVAAKRKCAKHYRELSDCFRKIFLITGEKFRYPLHNTIHVVVIR